MALLTPPPTFKKTAGFFKPYTPPEYYEDIWGTRDPDEELDKVDICESESDDEDGEAVEESLPGYDVFPSERDATHTQDVPNPGRYEMQYRIAPHVNARSSIPVTLGKQLTPKKFGMFAAYDPTDATAVANVESGDEEEDGTTGRAMEPGRAGSEQSQKVFQHRGSYRGADGLFSTPARRKRKRNTVTIARPETRCIISQDIAGHTRERKAALRAGRRSSGQAKSAIPTGPVRPPIVSEYSSGDELNADNTSSPPRPRRHRERLDHARETRAGRRGGRGQAASTPKDKGVREVGDQRFEELVKGKQWLIVDAKDINIDAYVKY